MKNQNTQGFTLIELSVVLVIIGLIIGGVLVGRELIKTAEIRSIITQIEQYDTAVNTFKLKYNCLPGDCATATNFSSGFTNGDGNGVICPSYDSGVSPRSFGPYYYNGTGPESECIEFWHQLSKMRLIPETIQSYAAPTYIGVGDEYPAVKNGGSSASSTKAGIWIFHPQVSPEKLQGRHGYFLTGQVSNDAVGAATFSAMDAYRIDSKIDDGFTNLSTNEKVFSLGDGIEDPWNPYSAVEGAFGVSGCLIEADPVTYNVTNTNRTADDLCSLVVRAGF